MTDDTLRKAAIQQRQLFRQTVYRIWGMVKDDRRAELSEKENNLAEILTDHEEYSDHFENIDILDGREYEAGLLFNPFLHISSHLMVEDQLSANSPTEAILFYKAIEAKGCSHHQAIHFMIMILLHVMHESASGMRPFDANRYKRLLTKCKEVETTEIDKIIENDLLENQDCQAIH